MDDRDKIYLKQIGQQIAKIRKSKRMTQADLCALANLEIPNLSAVENGRHNPSVLFLKKIADALEVELIEFFQAGIVISKSTNTIEENT